MYAQGFVIDAHADTRQHPTEHECSCGGRLNRVGNTTLLYCPGCGENRYLIDPSPRERKSA